MLCGGCGWNWNSQSACMSVAQHLMTHITQEKTLNQTIFQICGSYILCLALKRMIPMVCHTFI